VYVAMSLKKNHKLIYMMPFVDRNNAVVGVRLDIVIADIILWERMNRLPFQKAGSSCGDNHLLGPGKPCRI
jgi:hypothetical protein